MQLSWRSGPGLLVDEEVPGFARGKASSSAEQSDTCDMGGY